MGDKSPPPKKHDYKVEILLRKELPYVTETLLKSSIAFLKCIPEFLLKLMGSENRTTTLTSDGAEKCS